jgi:voltage-gated potassium channel
MTLRERLQGLYFGDDRRARRFRYGLIVFDVVTIAVFLVSSVAHEQWWMIPLDLVIAAVLILDFAARLYAENERRRHLLSLATAADLIVIVSLLLPFFVANLGFLRIARALRLLRSYHLLRDLRTDSAWFRNNEDIIQRSVSLGVFIFTPKDPAGRLIAVVIMLVGVSLFLRLLQAIFRPNKVRFECPDCGLMAHDIDAVHCKHCGRILHIRDEGAV